MLERSGFIGQHLPALSQYLSTIILTITTSIFSPANILKRIPLLYNGNDLINSRCLGLFFCFAIFTLNCLWRIPFPNGLNVVMLNEKAQNDRIVKTPIRSGKEFTKPAPVALRTRSYDNNLNAKSC